MGTKSCSKKWRQQVAHHLWLHLSARTEWLAALQPVGTALQSLHEYGYIYRGSFELELQALVHKFESRAALQPIDSALQILNDDGSLHWGSHELALQARGTQF